MNTLSFTASALAQSFSYALLYSLVQGVIVFIVLQILLKSFPAMSARARYYLSFTALSVVMIWFADTWYSHYDRLNEAIVYVADTANDAPQQASAATVAAEHAGTHGLNAMYALPAAISSYVPVILLVYCVGLVFMLVRFMISIVRVKSLARKGLSRPAAYWGYFVSLWQEKFGIARRVQLYLSDQVTVPMVLGTLRPVILLPVATLSNLSVAQLEAIILHELAHVKRHDYLLNIVQTIVETVLFFNPFVWLLSSVIRREREHCCDDLVVASASDPLHYAKALAELESYRISINSLALAATGNKNQLFHRIKRIMEMKKDNVAQSRLSAIVVAVIVTTFLGAMIVFTPSFAQKAKEDKTKVQKKTYKTVTVDRSGKKKVVTKTTNATVDVREGEDEDDVDIKISLHDDNKKNATAKIVVISKDDDKKSGGKARVKHEIVIKGDGDKSTAFSGDRVQAELARAKAEMDKVDWDEIQQELSSALAEVGKALDLENLAKEIKIEIHRELEKGKTEAAKAKREIVRTNKVVASTAISGSGSQAMASADSDEGSMNSDTNDFEDMLNKMEQDKLIDRSSKFVIEKSDDELFINGEKQPSKVLDKYSRYLNGREVTVKGGKGNLSINISN
jgi:bla regulator protein blaR1